MGFSFRNASALSILVGTAVAQGTKIFGCADVDCPTKGDTAINECTVANSTFINVGVAPITADDDLGPIAGFSWVQGMDEHGDSNNASRRVFETSFLLATPPSFYDERYGDRKACAALFHDLTEVSSDTNSACSAIEGACLEALRERATNLRFGDGDDPCERLGEDLRRNFDSECRGLLSDGINKWPELTVRSKQRSRYHLRCGDCGIYYPPPPCFHSLLTSFFLAIDGPGSIRPISDQANSSSNCWPVTEKESNLAFIEFRSESVSLLSNPTKSSSAFS